MLAVPHITAQASTLTTLYNFAGGTDGRVPSPVVIEGNGVLYGTTEYGGFGGCAGLGCGTVFSLTPPSQVGGSWTKTVLYSFKGGADGWYPVSGLAMGATGVLYGTTTPTGGPGGGGTIFALAPPASPAGAWTKTLLYTFNGASDGWGPEGPVVIGSGGVLYGMTGSGGPSGLGTVFSLTPPASPGGSWTEAILHNFAYGGSDGNSPYYGLVPSSAGVLYGATHEGGASNVGTIFSLTPPASAGGAWTETILYTFSNTGGGDVPSANVVIDKSGVLFGTTVSGGSSNGGVAFSLKPPGTRGGVWTYGVLHDFPFVNTYSTNPGPLLVVKDGILLGITSTGGVAHAGTIVALKPPTSAGASWTEYLLHTFTYTDGAFPRGLAAGSGGVFYGVTSGGGSSFAGTVFALMP
jgi:uncharacterized repeat protein (TIGR03803 family)